MISKWDDRFAALSRLISTWSKDPSTKVGAVIVDDHRRVVSIGYNGFPRGVADKTERYLNKPLKHEIVVHAEANAILNATIDLEGCTLYSTFFPCPHCASLIIQKGIARVVAAPHPKDEEYRKRREISEMMLTEAKIQF